VASKKVIVEGTVECICGFDFERLGLGMVGASKTFSLYIGCQRYEMYAISIKKKDAARVLA
jgi:hypothetical protein